MNDVPQSREKRVVIYCLVLVAVTLAFYNPIIHNQFTGFDDWSYILKNQQIQAGVTWATVKWSFTTFREGNWHPLTWLSHALDFQLFHLDPVGHHYINLLFHAANGVLLFLLLRRATGALWPSLAVAFLFCLHPTAVESVAWASERKNVLSTFFFLLALHSYDRYARLAQSSGKRTRLYISVAGLFTLGLLAKPQIVTLPFVLLLWDYWPLNRIEFSSTTKRILGASQNVNSAPVVGWSSLLLEKVPFFILAAADSTVTMFAQRAGNAVRSISEVSLAQRLANVPVSYVRYLAKLVWPARLAPLYPRSAIAIPNWQVIGSLGILLLLTAVVVRWSSRRYLAMGWLWFLGTLIPMIGIVTVGDQTMADRYAYIPFIGLFIAIVWGLGELAAVAQVPQAWRALPTVAVILIFGTLTSRQIKFWHDDETLWRYTLSVTDDNYVAHNNLALMYSTAGRSEEAIEQFRSARLLHKYPAKQVLALAFYELLHGHPQDAIEECNSVLAATSDEKAEGVAWGAIGQAHLQMRDYDLASEDFARALKLSPDNVMALSGSGVLNLRQGRMDASVSYLVQAVNNDPSDVNFLLLEEALRRDGRSVDADKALAEARRVSQDLPAAQNAAVRILAVAGIVPIEQRALNFPAPTKASTTNR